MNIGKSFEITICVEPREDGGVRVWSKELPTFVLSHSDPERVVADIPVVLRTMLSEMLGGDVEITQLVSLHAANSDEPLEFSTSAHGGGPHKFSFAAALAHG